jgi:uncharacterized Zn finger protein
MAWHRWSPYVPVAARRQQALRKTAALRKKGVDIQPIQIDGRKIAKTFWGAAWCKHLESFSDYDNRLPRGRTYVRNGSVCHLAITKGKIEAKVSGSQLYNLSIQIKTLSPKKWQAVKQRCAGRIASLLELLRGNLSDDVMAVVTDSSTGLFPQPDEITFKCDCPDWAYMCKHVAAVMYGIGARLDEKPELLFQLRGVKHEELIDTDAGAALSNVTKRRSKSKRLAVDELSDVFGIALDTDDAQEQPQTRARKKSKKTGSIVIPIAAKQAIQKRKKATRKKRMTLTITGAAAVLLFVRDNRGATTAQINAHWSQQGRGGTANATLTKLVQSRQVTRKPNKGARGSFYTVV